MMNKTEAMRLGFLSNHNVLDKRAFSGTPYYMFHSLEAHAGCSVRLLGEHRRPNRVFDRLRPRNVTTGVLPANTFRGLDVILSLVSTDRIPEVARSTAVPIVHVTDATPGFLREFYGRDVTADRDVAERRAIESANLVYYSSDFMRARALSDFGPEFDDKMAAFPWGANFDDLPGAVTAKPPLEPLRLVFIGTDWERKGGAVAVEALRALRARGVSAELHLIGAATEEAKEFEGVIAHGYLDKNRKVDSRVFQETLEAAHFFVLPTRADCTPMVIAEVNSYAIPALVTDVGGVGSLMAPGQNGEMMAPGASGGDYADRLVALSADREAYRALSESSFAHYRDRLNWRAWADHTLALLGDRFPTRFRRQAI